MHSSVNSNKLIEKVYKNFFGVKTDSGGKTKEIQFYSTGKRVMQGNFPMAAAYILIFHTLLKRLYSSSNKTLTLLHQFPKVSNLRSVDSLLPSNY